MSGGVSAWLADFCNCFISVLHMTGLSLIMVLILDILSSSVWVRILLLFDFSIFSFLSPYPSHFSPQAITLYDGNIFSFVHILLKFKVTWGLYY